MAAVNSRHSRSTSRRSARLDRLVGQALQEIADAGSERADDRAAGDGRQYLMSRNRSSRPGARAPDVEQRGAKATARQREAEARVVRPQCVESLLLSPGAALWSNGMRRPRGTTATRTAKLGLPTRIT
jgi:hypothetical protein